MRVHVAICAYVHIQATIRMYVFEQRFGCSSMHIADSVYDGLHMCTLQMHIYIDKQTPACMYTVRIYICIYMCIYICVYIYMYIYICIYVGASRGGINRT